MSWFTKLSLPVRKQNWSLCAEHCLARSSTHVILLFSVSPRRNKLGGGPSLTGCRGVVAGPSVASQPSYPEAPTRVAVWASVCVLAPTLNPSCSPGQTPAPAMPPPPSGCCKIKSSSDSSGLLSGLNPMGAGPPYRLCLASVSVPYPDCLVDYLARCHQNFVCPPLPLLSAVRQHISRGILSPFFLLHYS